MLGKLLDNRKRMLYVLAVVAAAAALLAAGITVLNAVGGDEVSAEAGNQAGSVVSGNDAAVDTSDGYAAEVFACKVEDVNDSAAVAVLLETMGVSNVTGKYVVHIAAREEGQVLSLSMEQPAEQEDASALDKNMTLYAQQMLALIPQIDKVEWIYTVSGSDGEKQAVGSLDDAGAAKALGKAPDKFGESENSFKKLLNKQAE